MFFELLKKLERCIIYTLIFLMGVVLAISTIELAWIIIKDIITEPVFFLEINEILDIFGFFLIILIGIELLDTIKVFLKEKIIHAEVVLLVSIMAIARKIIIIDTKEVSDMTLIGIGVIVLALSIGYYIIKKTNKDKQQ